MLNATTTDASSKQERFGSEGVTTQAEKREGIRIRVKVIIPLPGSVYEGTWLALTLPLATVAFGLIGLLESCLISHETRCQFDSKGEQCDLIGRNC
ncbi:hypothetical protein BaRGS_00002701 [Batillaria attramentaria]|uniref:Uncharacterized protein n=1 Tax=Batillaria attramentaria TaxID=370345 RepID=A0ABD0M2E2_9CAEN